MRVSPLRRTKFAPITSWLRRSLALAAVGVAVGCAPEPDFPEDFREQYTRVVTCVGSADHELRQVTIWASAEAAWAYQPAPTGASKAQHAAYPIDPGAVVVKEEFDDPGCTQLTAYTSMRKLDDWIFQKVDSKRNVIEHGGSAAIARCSGCHENCGAATDGLCGTTSGP